MKKISIVLFSFIVSLVYAQDLGTIRGKVYDAEYTLPFVDASVTLLDTDYKFLTDIDGEYSIEVPEGIYSVVISYDDFHTVTIENVSVLPGKITEVQEVFLEKKETDSNELKELVLENNKGRNTETALQKIKLKSAVILDGISASKLEITGDNNALEASKRITGLSVEGGKYVFVRGLGDRYSKTTLNGVEIPGLDPDRNTIQMDIFPVGLIDNILVSKNFSAELPADFSGGLVNIETKNFPTKKFTTVGLSLGYNPQMNLTGDFLSYDGGNTDFLGFDDGTRDLPSIAANNPYSSPTLYVSPDQEVFNYTNSFNKTLATEEKTSFLNTSISLSTGNQKEVGEKGNKLGYIFSFGYRNEFSFYDDVTYGEYQRNPDNSINDLRYANVQKGAYGEINTLLGIMGGLAYKSSYNKYRFTLMHIQNGNNKAGKFSIDNSNLAVGQSGYMGLSDNLEYNQRSITNALLAGEHSFISSNWNLEWKISPTFSISKDPDLRKTTFTLREDGSYYFGSGEGGFPIRIWRDLNEFNIAGKLDAEKKYTLFNENALFKAGIASTYKYREYEILQYVLQFDGIQSWSSPNSNIVLNEENIFPNGPRANYQSANNFPNPNEYKAESYLYAAYISNEFHISPKLKSVLGLRLEQFILKHSGRNQGNTLVLNNEKVLNSLDFFPSVNFIYSIKDNMNLRAVYARTIARPSFKEMSYAQIIDPFTNRIFNGGLYQYDDWNGNLRETLINNIDLRWEYFFGKSETVSLSAFYKSFKDPIELVRIPEQQTSVEMQPRNVNDGTLYGVEIEISKNFGFISASLENVSLSTNLTLLKSELSMSDTEYNSRKQFERVGENIEREREMAGQSPYVINAGIIYNNPIWDIETALFYNVKGSTLSVVGNGLNPDVYDSPFHDLNFSISKKLGIERNMTVIFRASNLLNDTRDQVFQSFGSPDEFFSTINPAQTFSLGFNYSF